MANYLIRKEFVIIRRKGSHATLRKDNKIVTIPIHNTKLKPGLTLGILGDVEISKEEFVNDFNSGLVK